MYRKFSAQQIFTGKEVLAEGYVLITETDGVVKNIVSLAEAGDDVEFFNGMLTPGFINAHCHLELSHMKGLIPEGTGLVDFVFAVMTQRQANEEQVAAAIDDAEQQMWQSGIVAVGDICNAGATIAQKQQRRLQYHNFVEVAGFVPAGAQSRFDAAVAVQQQFTNAGLLRTTLAPHAPYSVSQELFGLINEVTANGLVTIHNQETTEEDDFLRNKTGDFLRLYEHLGLDIQFFKPYGKSSLQAWRPMLNNNQSILLVHDVTTSAADVQWLLKQYNQTATSFCLCPNANLYITGKLPGVHLLANDECTIVLGTDSLASNHQIDIWAEIQTLHQHFPAIPLQSLLQWATINGAAALRMDNSLGSFEKGKQPGVVWINSDSPGGVINIQKAVTKRLL
ncbi:MAG: amidohydrolase family protein [Bacteroidetes bacterium]|nr:amidohydrolase family protein [Bacteroidota bacterium]